MESQSRYWLAFGLKNDISALSIEDSQASLDVRSSQINRHGEVAGIVRPRKARDHVGMSWQFNDAIARLYIPYSPAATISGGA